MPAAPPEFLRSLLDGATEASCVVLSGGTVWHMNEPARRLFHVVDGPSGAPVSTYLSFSTTHAPGRETLQLSWDELINPDAFANNKRQAEGIGMPAGGGRFPATITVVRVATAGDAPEETRSGQSSASDNSRRQDEAYYCLYIQDLTPARMQMTSLQEEVAHLLATKEAVICASGQSLVTINEGGSIQSVSHELTQMLGYEQDDVAIGQSVNLLLQEKDGGNIALDNHDRREVRGIHAEGSVVDLEVGIATISAGNIAIMVRNLTEGKERQQQEIRDKIAQDLELRDHILDTGFNPMFCIDKRGIIFMVNRASCEEFGYRREEFIGQNVSMIVAGSHKHNHDSYVQRYNETGEKRMIGKQREIRCLRNDGTEFPAELGLAEIPNGFCGFIRKLTKQKLLEHNALKTEEKFTAKLNEQKSITRGIFDASFDAIFVINDRGVIQDVNERCTAVFGWTREEFVGQNITLIMTGSDEVDHTKYIETYMKTGLKKMINTRREVTAKRKDESTFPCILGLSQARDTGLFCGFIHDMSSEKAFQSEIDEGQKHVKDQKSINLGILDASFDALFVINNQGIIQQVNETSTTVFGWTREEFVGQNICMIMTSDIAASHDQYLKNYLQTGIKKMMGTQREVTAQRKDKSTFPCVLGLSQARDTGLFCGFIRDLTAEKAAQSEIVERNLHMTRILDASFDALFCINEHGIIHQINFASTKVFGWTKEELLGQNISMIMPEGHAKRHDSYLESYLRTGFKKMIGTQREVEAKRKDGTCFPCILGLSEMTTHGEKEFVGFIKDVTVQKSLLVAQAEQEASDSLLHNILPEHIAHRLKQDPSHIADHYENTTILFADIVGFTDRATAMSPHDVVTMLNDLFSRFDYLVDRYDINKVKTIGDCYMVTSIPSSDLEHDGCSRVCRFALDLMKAVHAFNERGPLFGHIEVRVGIACGQVVAGVVGTKRFLFDMWGDAVNVAARMEQHGLPGQIQVTKEVVDNAGSDFTFECRGPLTVKGKGEMDTYILKSAKPRQMRRSVYSVWKPTRAPTARANSNHI